MARAAAVQLTASFVSSSPGTILRLVGASGTVLGVAVISAWGARDVVFLASDLDVIQGAVGQARDRLAGVRCGSRPRASPTTLAIPKLMARGLWYRRPKSPPVAHSPP